MDSFGPAIAGKPSTLSRLDTSAFAVIWGAFIGHSNEHLKAIRAELDDQLQAGKISADEHELQVRHHSSEQIEKQFKWMLEKWAGDETFQPFQLTEAVEQARRKTFDRHGNRKETDLTPIYREIFSNWIRVERMSGPKDLTQYLSDMLGHQDFEDKYERVKKICQRMGVRFRGRVKGQRRTDPLSLPPR